MFRKSVVGYVYTNVISCKMGRSEAVIKTS